MTEKIQPPVAKLYLLLREFGDIRIDNIFWLKTEKTLKSLITLIKRTNQKMTAIRRNFKRIVRGNESQD
jgi:hypothetical protein